MTSTADVEVQQSAIGPLPWLTLRGPRRQIFRHLGQSFGEVIATFLARRDERERVNRSQKSPHLGNVLDATQRHLPGPISELRAMAEGAEVPFEELLLLNIRGDLGLYSEGCSDLGLQSSERLLLAHNEDADPIHEGDCPLLTLLIEGDLPLTTYWYPGMLTGMTFWLNEAGLACGIDHIPVETPGSGVGRQFLARHLAGATSLGDFIDRAKKTPSAGGYTYMVGSAREQRLATIEVGPSGISTEEVTERYAHTNHFLSLTDRQVIDAQSGPRLDILRSVPPAGTPDEAIETFTNPTGGIWRDATGGDPLMTLCSAVFDFRAQEVLLHPRGDSENHRFGFGEFLSLGDGRGSQTR